MSSYINIRALGLNTSPNQLGLPDGSLNVASNVNIQRDNIIEPRRGYKLYNDEVLSSMVKQLFVYRNRLIAHYGTTLAYDSNGSGDFREFNGSYDEAETGLRIKSVNINDNLYFTSANGIQKISATSSSDFTTSSGFISKAGGLKATNLKGKFNFSLGSQSGFFTRDSAVGYKIVWGRKDLNNNLILGTPSEKLTVYNYDEDLIKQDFNNLLNKLDLLNVSAQSIIRDGNYSTTYAVSSTDTIETVYNNALGLAEKLDTDIYLADDGGTANTTLNISAASITTEVCTITFSAGDPRNSMAIGDVIYLTGFSAATGTINGFQTIVATTSTTISFNVGTTASGAITFTAGKIYSGNYRSITEPSFPSAIPTNTQLIELHDYIGNIIARLQDELTDVISSTYRTRYITDLALTTTGTVDISINIPKDVTSIDFFQIYRTALATADGPVSIEDLVPNEEYNLIYEAFPSTAELAQGYIRYNDNVPEAFRINGTYLYTNATTGDTSVQANDIPPFAKDIEIFKNYTFYANTRTRQRFLANLIGTDDLTTGANLLISNGTKRNKYEFVPGVAEVSKVTTGSDTLASVGGKYFTIYSANDFTPYYVWFRVDGAGTDPAVSNKTGIRIDLESSIHASSANNLAAAISSGLKYKLDDFSVSVSTNEVSIACSEIGETTNIANVNVPNTAITAVSTTTAGVGTKVAKQITTIQTIAASGITAGDYFLINDAFNNNSYYVWFRKSGAGSDPAIVNKTAIVVDILTGDNANTVASKLEAVLTTYTDSFTTSVLTDTVTVTNVGYGPCVNASDVNAGFTINVTTSGDLKVAIYDTSSSAQNIDLTARALVDAINLNKGDNNNAYYLSGVTQLPGSFLVESTDLNDDKYYFLTDSAATGASFTPDLSPLTSPTITAASVATTTVLTFSGNHGLVSGDQIVIADSTTTPSIDGLYTVTKISDTTLSIPVNVSNTGTAVYQTTDEAYSSDNEAKVNRVYYSKFQQPESVPIVNYIDVGGSSAIKRIVSFRDSLFVFKEDSLYRISGEVIPFNVALFDNSLKIICPDSIGINNNQIYFWSTQGIQGLSETGGQLISRSIDNLIIPLNISSNTNFKTATWGIGYDSDNSYIVYTTKTSSDTYPTIGYRYSSLTNTWTTYDLSFNAGIVNTYDDKMYVAETDTNRIGVERKNFNRTDHADREIEKSLDSGNLNTDGSIRFGVVTDINIGDVVAQEQTLSVYEFNALLKKLDNDSGVTDDDYFDTLEVSSGDNLRDALVALATKLDSDAGVNYTSFASDIGNKTGYITGATADTATVLTTNSSHGLITGRKVTIASSTEITPSIDGTYIITVLSSNTFSIPFTVEDVGTIPGSTITYATENNDFTDLKICYNDLIGTLNTDTGVSFSNYSTIDTTTLMEAVVLSRNLSTKTLTLSQNLQFIQGDILVYKKFRQQVDWSPIVMGDPLGWKHLREATLMFDNKAFTSANLSFKTDLFPEYIKVDFEGAGSGLFGNSVFGEGFFGGSANSAPFRTYVPRQCQRCRYIQLKYVHEVAREKPLVYGLTLTGNISQSERAYKS